MKNYIIYVQEREEAKIQRLNMSKIATNEDWMVSKTDVLRIFAAEIS